MNYLFSLLVINASTTHLNAASTRKSGQATGWGQALKVAAHSTLSLLVWRYK